MLADDTMLCGCTGIQHDGKWWCPQGHEYVESWMAGEITTREMDDLMRLALWERKRW